MLTKTTKKAGREITVTKHSIFSICSEIFESDFCGKENSLVNITGLTRAINAALRKLSGLDITVSLKIGTTDTSSVFVDEVYFASQENGVYEIVGMKKICAEVLRKSEGINLEHEINHRLRTEFGHDLRVVFDDDNNIVDIFFTE